MIMGYTKQDIFLFLKVTVMQVGYQMLKTQNLIVIMCLHYGEQQSHGNPQNKWLFPDPQWSLSL